MLSREIIVTYAVLALVVILFVPVPIGPLALRGGIVPNSADAPLCVALEFSPETRARHDLPTAMRLRSTPAGLGRGWFAADGRPLFGGYEFAAWRPAGQDSIDIMWHHSPLIRLPLPLTSPSTQAVGRLTSTWDASLVTRVFFADAAVTALSTPCDLFGAVRGLRRHRPEQLTEAT